MIAAIVRVDAATGDVYFVPGGKGSLMRLNPRSQQWQTGWGRAQVTAHATAAIDPSRHLLVAVGKGTADGVRQAWKWNLEQPSAPVDLRRTTSGDFAVERAMAPGFAFHPPTGKFVAWIGGTDLLTLDPEDWEWQRIHAAPGSADPGPPSPRGTYGRFQYVPRLDAFALVNDVDQDVFLVRPDFAGDAEVPEVPAPAISLRADPSRVVAGESPTLSWAVDGADRCEAFGSWTGQRALRGTANVAFAGERAKFGLRCVGRGGDAQTSIVVTRPALPTVSIVANPTTVEAGGATTLRWEATPHSRCAARGAWHGPRNTQGSEVVAGIFAGAQFELECDGDGGSGVAKVSVHVARAAAQDLPRTTQNPPRTTIDDTQTHGLGHADLLVDALLLLGAFGAPARRRLSRR